MFDMYTKLCLVIGCQVFTARCVAVSTSASLSLSVSLSVRGTFLRMVQNVVVDRRYSLIRYSSTSDSIAVSVSIPVRVLCVPNDICIPRHLHSPIIC